MRSALSFALLLATATSAQELPERPALSPDVLNVQDGGRRHGNISSFRSTDDGRVRITGNAPGTYRLSTTRVELFTDSVPDGPRTSDGQLRSIDLSPFHASKAANAVPGHVTLCDPYLADGVAKNPYACEHLGRTADCYDVGLVQIVNFTPSDPTRLSSEIWSAPVTLTVQQPKTARANVAKLELRGAPVRSPIASTPRRSGDNLLEPVISGDGRLLILNSGDTLLYSVIGGGDAPCDARGWRKLSHLSRMHRDSAAKRYDLGRYPIRDTENKKIRAGKPIRGAYPWIDRAAKNLFFTQVGSTGLFYAGADGKIQSRFKVLNPPRRRRIEFGEATRFGISYLGLWTQGKVVVTDSRVNNLDYHVGERGYLPRLRLYSDAAETRVGHGTVTRINSPENQWNYRAALQAHSPRDVVWWLSANNGMTGEVVFDDQLDLGTLIFSPMNAAVHNRKRLWRDGFDYKRLRGYVNQPRLQNAAVSELRWKLPRYGTVVGARIEPLAAGGVQGKGLWLDGAGRVHYQVPAQPLDARDEIWTTSLWIDARDATQRRRLLSFPDGSWVDLSAGSIHLGGGAGAETNVALPASLQTRSGAWTHLAFLSTPSETRVYVQGYRLWTGSGAYLRVGSGALQVGSSPGAAVPGFRGWIDELRVVSGPRNPETLCNYANGTLRGLDPETVEFAQAGDYPQGAHDEISSLLTAHLRPSWQRYRCERERDASHPCLESAHRFDGVEASCVRGALLFPEGPLFHDMPRPDSRANTFCLSCHVAGHPTRSLRAAGPLAGGPPESALSDDPRRQPAQAPERIHGYLPRAVLGLPEARTAPPEGLPLDPLLYPGFGGLPTQPHSD